MSKSKEHLEKLGYVQFQFTRISCSVVESSELETQKLINVIKETIDILINRLDCNPDKHCV